MWWNHKKHREGVKFGGNVCKGGVNSKPLTLRPPLPPKGQGVREVRLIIKVEGLKNEST